MPDGQYQVPPPEQGDFGMEDFAKMFKPGLMELLAPGIGTFAGGLLGGLGKLFGGESEEEKRRKKVFGMAESQYGQEVFDPNQFMADIQRELRPQVKRRGEIMEKRLGMDVGVAQGELFSELFEAMSGTMIGLKTSAAQAKASRDMQLLLSEKGCRYNQREL